MTFTVLLHPKAAEELNKIRERLTELRGDPEAAGKRLRYTGFWSTRIGDYHAIYEIKRDRRQVIVLYIGHRRNVYDDFSRIF
ncbi:type II toxin-antitoxin system RelE/ParE family toxin [Candidatus Bathyarchaeota archaeon]|nr:type II toxin-antitoxin system RelE/ParE family toxin [Candidatus Bathyarchaeota archaeon]